MVAQRLRAFLFAAFVLAAWAFARPAQAAPLAPFCDDRGATAIASPPALEAPDQEVRRAAPPPCDGGERVFGLAFKPLRRPSRSHSMLMDQAYRVSAVALAPPPVQTIDFVVRETSAPYGVRVRIERPPRGAATRAT